MTHLMKPSLPPGWSFADGATVERRVSRERHVEVFRLTSQEYLYLFHEPGLSAKLADKGVPHEVISVYGEEVVAKRYSDHVEGKGLKRAQALLQRGGLDAIAGMAELKQILQRDVIHPFLNWETYERYGVAPANGILFFGPPGCGKTFIAHKVAEAINAEFVELNEGGIGSPYIHETSKNIAEAFKRAAERAPCVLFIDELSGILPRRDGLSSSEQFREGEIGEFLIQMEGCVRNRVLVIGATNFPERVDPAVLRSGRMDKRIFIAPPDLQARMELFALLLEDRPCAQDLDLHRLATATEGLVSSDIKLLVNNAALKALYQAQPISQVLLEAEVQGFQPSLSQGDLEQYVAFQAMHRA